MIEWDMLYFLQAENSKQFCCSLCTLPLQQVVNKKCKFNEFIPKFEHKEKISPITLEKYTVLSVLTRML